MIKWGKVWSDFFIVLALTSNIGFIFSEDPYQLVIAITVNLIATVLKFGAKKILTAEMLSASLVADLHLIPATLLYFTGTHLPLAKALAIGAAVANVISIVLLIVEIVFEYRREEEERF
ncbi:DUF6394 family protein [Venenivibrio stagnispumantis]|uniref:MacA n=1 Tax=Venenivibrio stagnispumantis TaxID=407998 RepID=A0AA45WM75_9AQUI|nr:DUF6394 family protein [Venenivibrio stagnispumantis]MCW4572837.1 DUF6394 family protein [Venenivibrio stagnispumantis]SMP13488.1 hypothetical protein SAMN06264868_1113 [Venenivibrio stagnispumantis]